MKKLLTLVTFLFSFISTAQFLQSRLLKVEQKNMEKFMSAVANKQNFIIVKKVSQIYYIPDSYWS